MYSSKKEIAKVIYWGLARTIGAVVVAIFLWLAIFSHYLMPFFSNFLDIHTIRDFILSITAIVLFLGGGIGVMFLAGFIANWGKAPKCPICKKGLFPRGNNNLPFNIVVKTGKCPNCGYGLIN